MGGFSSLLTNNGVNNSNFQFEFPRFGGLPGSHILDNGPLSKKTTSTASSNTPSSTSATQTRHNSTGRSLSPKSVANSSGSAVTSPASVSNQRTGSTNSFYNFNNTSTTTDASPGQSRVFHFNSNSSTHSVDSPASASSNSAGPSSSCDTSPEPSHASPKNPDTIADGYVCHGNSEGEITFCEKLNMACGNPRNPIPRAMSVTKSDANTTSAGTNTNPATADFSNLNSFDFFANQNGGQFDPTLFGEYRESQAAIVGDGDFTNGFFNDAFPLADFGSPFHFGDTPAVQKTNPLEEIERLQEGEDEVVPGEDVTQMLNCHKIWLVSFVPFCLYYNIDVLVGISWPTAPISRMAPSISTICARSSVPRRAAQRAVSSWITRTWRQPSSACPRTRSRHSLGPVHCSTIPHDDYTTAFTESAKRAPGAVGTRYGGFDHHHHAGLGSVFDIPFFSLFHLVDVVFLVFSCWGNGL